MTVMRRAGQDHFRDHKNLGNSGHSDAGVECQMAADGRGQGVRPGNLGAATQIQALHGGAALGGADLLQSLTYGNGLVLAKTYSLDNELTRLKVSNGATIIVDRTYVRADLANLTGVIDGIAASNNESLGYNDAARLSSASGAFGTRSWTYDSNGNRLSETANGVVSAYAYPPGNNRLANVKQGAATARAFAYDMAGNVIQDLRGAAAYN
jgi:YD repeat-containing protein